MDIVTLTHFEATGPGSEVALEHFAQVDASRAAAFAVAAEFGAETFRPSPHDGRPVSLVFRAQAAPSGFRLIRMVDGMAECAPHKGARTGRAAAAAMQGVAPAPNDLALASAFGWSPPHYPISDRGIWFPTSLRVFFPTVRIFVSLPRFEGDGWDGHPGLLEVPPSTRLKAIEDHNAIARAQREAA